MKLRLRFAHVASLATCLAVMAAASASSALVVALSNDDGWDAPGIQAMKAALVAAGHTVTLYRRRSPEGD